MSTNPPVMPIYDSFKKEYKTPFGAAKRLTGCVFTLRFPTYMQVERPTLVMFRPGYKEKHMNLEYYSNEDGVYNLYTCTYTPQDLGLHYYYFSVTMGGNRSFIKRTGASEGSLGGTELFQLTVYDENVKTMDWLKGGIMYQIFPDRFSKHVSEEESVPLAGRTFHTDWSKTPDWKPDAKGVVTNSDYFGGNLKGIEERLDYLYSLGVTCIYLNPIFESHENHRYNTANYERIDPTLGTEADFVSLCEKAKRLGIGIILDGVFSHTGADSVYFNKYGRYGSNTGAYRDPESPYRKWYNFTHYPNVYESWWGFESLPNVNENDPNYTEFICGENGVLQKWLKLGASGWRLDVVDELPDEFIDALNKAVKGVDSDKVIYGEVWEDATTKESYGVRRRYLIGGQLDSVMNYPFKEAILRYIRYSDCAQFRDGVMTILERYPKPSVDILMNFLSTHDIERALTRLAGAEIETNGREWQAKTSLSDAEYIYGISLMKCAMVLQFFLPGIPCVYYGDEAGAEGYKDPFNRRTYPWGRENTDLLKFTRELAAIRKGCQAFAEGEMEFLEVTEETCVFLRKDYNKQEAAAVFLNKSKRPRRFSLKTVIGEDWKERDVELVRAFMEEERNINVAPYDYAVVKYAINRGEKAMHPLNHQKVSEEILIYES
ncbi:MAG: glycoside hydrolase family 13 protein [Oscillospiraceae bacterium]|nr:glycoside hydrolase family 13 protein [Oscillospiraceae bacterium]